MTTTVEHHHRPEMANVPSLLDSDEYRVDGVEKVSGQGKYSADFEMPGMLHAAYVRSTFPHARIVSIDTTAAKAMEGVHAVLTGADIGDRRFGRRLCDYPVLAFEKVRLVGELVVAVAADTPEIAQAAADAIEVEYEELPALHDPLKAMDDDAPILHETPENYHFFGGGRRPVPHRNVQGHQIISKGDGQKGYELADRIFEHTYTTPKIYAGSIEPRATLVWIDTAGVVHVVSTNKAPYGLRDQFAVVTGLPKTQIVIEANLIGGDFGGKGMSIEEFSCYFLAKETGRPVKHVRSHVDDIGATTTRHAARITFKTGVKNDGTLVCFGGKIFFDGGAYAAAKNQPTMMAGNPRTPYRVPHVFIERFNMYTNGLPGGSVRAPGDIQWTFALESHIDMIAEGLGIDPLEFRRRNVLVGDEADIDGVPHDEPKAVEVLDALHTAARWGDPLPPGRGRGISLAVRHIGGGNTSLLMQVDAAGTISIITGATDQGNGTLTVAQRCVCAELDLPLDLVRAERVATGASPDDPGSGGSKVAHIVGQASLDGARRLRERLEAAASTSVGLPAGSMELHGGDFVAKSGAKVSWKEAARLAVGDAAMIEVTGKYEEPHHEAHVHNFSAYMIELSVDRETGEITIHDVLFVFDTGTVINPLAHRGQINGGFVFGLGHALLEDLRVEDGRIVNGSYADYKLPSQADIPPFRVVLLKAPGPGPFGAKMVGEASTSGVAPAIANAIAAACGARVVDMPLTAEKIFNALGNLQPA